MRTTKRWLVFAVIAVAFSCQLGRAATYTAASCNESDVQAAYRAEQASAQDGDIIAIPAGGSGGTCTWSTQWVLSPTNSLTIQGAGALIPSTSCTFTPGSACTTTSGSDLTTITDGTSSGHILLSVTIATNKTFRITGIHYYFPSSNTNTGTNGQWSLSGANGTQQVRIDHNHFDGYAGHWIVIAGWTLGVADHNLADLYLPDTNWIYMSNGIGWNGDNTNYGNGNGSWADYSYWGSNKAFFLENNVVPADQTMYALAVNDCGNGGRQVFRYNTFESPSNLIQAHEGGTDNRGCRTTEVYGNTSTAVGAGVLVGSRSGSVIAWGNNGSWQRIYTPSIDRTNTSNGTFNPNNLGLCGQGASGTATSSGSTVTWATSSPQTGSLKFASNWPDESTPNMVFNGTSYPIASCSNVTTCTLTGLTGSNPTPVAWYAPSVWDENTNSSGYACFDQPGRGKGDLITGNFSSQTRIDSALGKAGWPREAVDPNYVFNNTNSYSGGVCVSVGSSDTNLIEDNRDYYQQFGSGCESGTFNGNAGVGQGLYSAIPSTCTAGPGGNTPGVGYWATDQNTLYVCNPTNTWTPYYTPYIYPHPLTVGVVTPPTPTPNPPTDLTAVTR